MLQLRPTENVATLFQRLLFSGQSIRDAELVGASAGVDVLSLYEHVADKLFAVGQFERAKQYVFLFWL